MSSNEIVHDSVNPHPVPDARRLAQVNERTLRDVIRLHRGRTVPSERLAAAGVPSLRVVLVELQRRQDAADRQAAA